MASTDVPGESSSGSKPPPARNFQVLEAVLHASIYDDHKDQLIERLKGMTDPFSSSFEEHEMVFALKSNEGPDVQLRLRRRFNLDLWHVRYVGTPIADKCPAVCRASIDSVMYTKDMMDFVKHMGFRLIYEFVMKGWVFTRGPIKILVYKLCTTDKPGIYSKELIKPFGTSHIVEASIPVENEDTMKYSKLLKDFTDQLMPLVEFRKVEYFRPRTGQFAKSS
uniref:Mediator of RNA polymerase II transcription subunit 18 n=1 Tax=Panagrellus redivivus TaxID=6233 RepID=A0A7E4VG89_PANRE